MTRLWLKAAVFLAAAGLVLFLVRPPGGTGATRAETRFLMGTLVTVTLAGEIAADPSRADGALADGFAALEAVDRAMARNPGTELFRLDAAGSGEASPPLAAVITSALGWAERSGGAFDPTVAPLIDLWDVNAGPHPPPSDASLASARARTGWRRVTREEGTNRFDLGGTTLDLGGIAKGYGVDRAAATLRAAGAGDFVINAGGDLFVSGTKNGRPWRVGIQDPRDPERMWRVVTPREGAFVTSGDYERTFEWEGVSYHHLLDPATGSPARGCRSVTVWAENAMDADALATAVFVLGPEKGLALLEAVPGAEGLVLDAEGRERATAGFAAAAPESAP